MSTDLNSTEFLKALSNPKPDSTKLVDIINSVFKASTGNIVAGEVPVVKKIKVKHNALREAVLTFRDLTLHFNKDGIAETEEYNKGIIEIEQMYRPGCFTFVEEVVVEEDITVDQFLDKARKELEEELIKEEQVLLEDSEESNTESEEITKEQTPNKKGRKGKR